jgi:predicted ATPase/DNA-binding CsgD family transcriptional regulator
MPGTDRSSPRQPGRHSKADKHNLPSHTTPLIGRERETADLAALVRSERVVTLIGSGGVGKTRLAQRVASEVLGHFAGGAWFVDLAPVNDRDSVAAAALVAVGGVQQPFTAVLDQLVTVLRPESALLVLDNCEHLSEECSRLVETLLQGCPQVAILATSREPLAVRGEVTWRVASLSLPKVDDLVGTTDFERFDALSLFWERARRASPQISITDERVEASARICRRLDGIPLAIEIAAARCRQFSPERIARDLEDHYRLVGGGRDRMARQRTLEASVEWSHELLDSEEKIAFRRIGVLTSWFPLEAAEGVVASVADLDRMAVLELIGRLVDKSLLVIDEEVGAGEPHYRMLEAIRFYALARARDAGEIQSLREAHAEWWSNWASEHPITAIPSPTQIAEFDHCYPNLRAALEWLRPDPARAATLVQSLGPWMVLRGFVDDIRLLAIPVAVDLYEIRHPSWPTTVGSLALPAIAGGHLDFLLGPVNEAFNHAEAAGDFATATACLHGLAFLDQSAQRWRTLADYGARAGLEQQRSLGEMAYHSCVPEDVQTSHDALRALVDDEPKDSAARPYLLSSWANTLLILGEYEQAHRCFRDAVTMRANAARGEPTVLLWVLATGAAEAMCRHDPSDLDKIIRLSRVRALRGVAAFWAGVWQQTIAISAHRLRGVPLDVDQLVAVATAPIPPTAWRVGYALIARELLDRAAVAPVQALLDGLTSSALAHTPYHRLFCTMLRAAIAHSEGDSERAEHEWRDLLTLAVDQGARPLAVDSLEALGSIVAPVAPVPAARLLGAAQSARDAIAYRLRFTVEQQRHDDAHTLLIDSLGSAEFEQALVEGRAMSLSDARSYAQRTRGERRRPTFGWESLTPTEQDVARLVAEGATNPEIARKLLMSVNTVKTHLAHTYTKLGIASRAELTSHVVRNSH